MKIWDSVYVYLKRFSCKIDNLRINLTNKLASFLKLQNIRNIVLNLFSICAYFFTFVNFSLEVCNETINGRKIPNKLKITIFRLNF